jgi:NTP pyrophosphatase (non-canonical NTP hydrolase)
MDEQRRVATFLAEHDLSTSPTYRVLDLVSEVGELAKEVETSTNYGADPEAVTVAEDELGDALFALLALAEESGHDAGAALETSLAKYQRRVAESGDAGSGDP